MGKILFIVIMVALASAFVVLLMKKWGVTEWMQVHGDRISSELFSCDFCLSFWTSLLFVFVIVAVTDDTSYMTIPLVSTPIARLMLL